MRKALAMLLLVLLVVSLLGLSNPTVAKEEDGTGDSEGGGETGGESTPDDSHQHVGSPEDEQEIPPGEQEQLPPETGHGLPDVLKVGIAAGTIGALIVAFFVFMRRSAASI